MIISDQIKNTYVWQVCVVITWKNVLRKKKLGEFSITVDEIGNSSRIFFVFKLNNSLSRREIIHLQSPNTHKMIHFHLDDSAVQKKQDCLPDELYVFIHTYPEIMERVPQTLKKEFSFNRDLNYEKFYPAARSFQKVMSYWKWG